MAITQSQQSPGTLGAQFASGSYFDDAGSPVDAVITIGFKPRYVCVDNVTDRIKVEWYQGMSETSNTCVKTAAAGTRTLETTNEGILVSATTFTISNNATLALLVQNKQLRWYAMA
jgi:hypothetical protein